MEPLKKDTPDSPESVRMQNACELLGEYLDELRYAGGYGVQFTNGMDLADDVATYWSATADAPPVDPGLIVGLCMSVN
jgi:hypothetical protein